MYSKRVFFQSLVRSIWLLFDFDRSRWKVFTIFIGFLLLTPAVYALEYSSDNPETITAGTVISVTGGCPPYTWSINKCGVDFSERTTNEAQNTISVTETNAFCGTGTITITDNCGETVSGEVRSQYGGGWVRESHYYSIPDTDQCSYDGLLDYLYGTSCRSTEIKGGTKIYWVNYDSPCNSWSSPYLGGCVPQEYPGGTLFTYYKTVYKWNCLSADNPSELDKDNDTISDCKDACPNTSAFGTRYINYEGCDPIGYANVSGMELGVDSNKVNPNCGQNLIGGPH